MKFRCYYDDIDKFGYAEMLDGKIKYNVPEGKKFNWEKADEFVTTDDNGTDVYMGDICMVMDTYETLGMTFNEERLKYNLVNEARTFDNEEFLEIGFVVVSNMYQKDKKVHTLFVDGTEVVDFYDTLDNILEVFDSYENDGYENIEIMLKEII